MKEYYHIGVAVDTEQGLLVPVLRNADQKNVTALATELEEMAEKARNQDLVKEDMEGGTFTVTNLGGIAGTTFSPIVNYPEVAILGVGQASSDPRQQRSGRNRKRLQLPLSLSYDHRVINGADGARFIKKITSLLGDSFEFLAEI